LLADRGIIEFNDGRKQIADKDPNLHFNYGNVKSYWGVSHVKQINNFYEALKNDEILDITAEDAYKTQEMICAIYESGKTRKNVVL